MQTDRMNRLMHRWRRQFPPRRRFGHVEPRPIAGVGLYAAKATASGLVRLRDVTLIAVYDELRPCGRVAVRVSAYRPRIVRHGVQWASVEDAIAYRDLAIQPSLGGRNLRMNLARESEVRLAIQLDRMMSVACRAGRRGGRLRMPRLWAGFTPEVAATLAANGPEFKQLCTRFDLPAASMQAKFLRHEDGLALLPMDWVGDVLSNALEIFVEVDVLPWRKLFRYDRPEDLQGYWGASSYDFYANRFRARYEARDACIAAKAVSA